MQEVLNWFMSNWEIPAGVATFIASFLIPGARRIWPIMFKALVTEKAIFQAVIYFMDHLTKSSKNNLDNTLWAPVRKALMKYIAQL